VAPRPVAVSAFAGFGGSSIGLRRGGFRVAAAVELDAFAADVYELNAPRSTRLLRADVRDLTGADLLEAAGVAELDLFDGSPPCQDWSTMGARNLGGDRASLYMEFVRLVAEARPRAFVAENVSGLALGRARAVGFLPILAAFRDAGYDVASRVLDGQWLGVPQARRRVVVIGFRSDLGLDPAAAFPRPSKAPTTLGDALPEAVRLLRVAMPGNVTQWKYRHEKTYPAALPTPTICATGMDANMLDWVAIENRGEAPRPLTAGELAALSTFPEGFRLPEGTRVGRAWRGFGNSVPPAMAASWARGVRRCLAEAPSQAACAPA
jgi:DNA (cytosine-5)-methyltransferase 1